jgi:hypothetical protein
MCTERARPGKRMVKKWSQSLNYEYGLMASNNQVRLPAWLGHGGQNTRGKSFRSHLLFSFPQFFINFFFNICKHLVDVLYIPHTLEHEKIGFHVFPNNHAKKDGTTQKNYCFHYFSFSLSETFSRHFRSPLQPE